VTHPPSGPHTPSPPSGPKVDPIDPNSPEGQRVAADLSQVLAEIELSIQRRMAAEGRAVA
jgi:hypothetical protein